MKFVDLHTHGRGRHDTRGSAGDVLKLAVLHGKAGVGAILPAVYSGPIERMRRAVEAVREASAQRAKGAADILGVHLEGPFLNPARCGALDAGSFLKPTLARLGRLVEGHEDFVKVVTVAPELPGALRVIEKCASMGIRVNMGHSDATRRQALEGKRAGATGVTHLFNAMRPFHHREPGLAGLGLVDDDLYVEVVADGVHLGGETLRLVFRAKRPERIMLVSDSVKGPMYRKGVLQGSGTLLPGAAGLLRGLGVSERAIRLAGRINPLRYLKGR